MCEMDNLQLIDFSKEDDCLLEFSFCDSVEDVRLSRAVGFDNVNESMIKRGEMGSVERRRLSLLRKSLDWNSAFFTSQGLLNPEELSMINKVFKKAKSRQQSSGTREDVKRDIHKRSKVPINIGGLASSQAVMEHRTRKSGAGFTLPKRSHRGDLSSNETSFMTPTTEKSTVDRSNESPSSASSKCITRNIKLRNIKLTTTDPSSVLSPMSSNCSSSTSPARSIHNRTSPSVFKTPCPRATRSSIRNIKSSGRRMPSPKIDFFDEEQPVFRGSVQKLNKFPVSNFSVSTQNCSKVRKVLSREHDERKFSTRCRKPKTNGQIHIEISKNRMDIERKIFKDDCGSFQEKAVNDMKKKEDESDQVNGLSSHLESIDLDIDAEVKRKHSCEKHGQPLVETSRLSLLRKSLDWDAAFFISAGLLNTEEISVINKGFTKANSSQPSSETRKDVQPHLVYDQNRALADNDGFNVETFKEVIPDIHTMNKEQKSLTDDIASYHGKCVIDIEKNKGDCESQEDSRRFSSLRKSLDWNSDLCHGAGLLNPEELFKLQEGLKKSESSQSTSETKIHIVTHTFVGRDQSLSDSDGLHLGTLEADLFKSTSLTSPTAEKNPKVHHSNRPTSSGSPKCSRRKITNRNTKPTTYPSGTSPACSFHVTISASDFQCSNVEVNKYTSECATRSLIRNIKPSGLRMPSPKIGFFDEEPPFQPTFRGGMKRFDEFPSMERRLSFMHKAYEIGPSSLVQVC